MAGRGGTSNSAQTRRERERAQRRSGPRSNNAEAPSRNNARTEPTRQSGPRRGAGSGSGGLPQTNPTVNQPTQTNPRTPRPTQANPRVTPPTQAAPRVTPPPQVSPSVSTPPQASGYARSEVDQGGRRTTARGNPQSVSQRLRTELLSPRSAPTTSNPAANRASRLARGAGRAGLIGAGIAGGAALYDYFTRPSPTAAAPENAPVDMTPGYGEGVAMRPPARPSAPTPRRPSAPQEEMTADRLNDISLALIQGRDPQPRNAAEAMAVERMRQRMQGNGMAKGGMVKSPNHNMRAKRLNAVKPPSPVRVATPKPPSVKMRTSAPKYKGSK